VLNILNYNEPEGECVPIPALTNQPPLLEVGIMAKLSIPKVLKICQVEGCCSTVHSQGRHCSRHDAQIRRHGHIFGNLHRSSRSPNEFLFEDDICKIRLYDKHGNFVVSAIIDVDDYPLVKDYKWRLNSPVGYVRGAKKGGKDVLLHTVLMGTLPNGKSIDHANRKPLDNRRNNLRLATRAQNCFNRTLSSRNTSGYKGVQWRTDRRKWKTIIIHNAKVISIGTFKSKIEAARAYNEKATELFGEFACLNDV